MGELTIMFEGVNAYVPNKAGTALTVVMPNASGLGTSPRHAPGVASSKRHLPTMWWDSQIRGFFPGTRLSIKFANEEKHDFHLAPEIMDISTTDNWFDLDPAAVREKTDPNQVAAQVFIDQGDVSLRPPPTKCRKADRGWSGKEPGGLDQVVFGLELVIESKLRGAIVAEQPGGKSYDLFPFDLGLRSETIYLGNVCAEDIVGWPQGTPALAKPGTTIDEDFNWLYQLKKTGLDEYSSPVVSGLDLPDNLDPGEAFERVRGTGGGIGCECQGCIPDPNP